MSEPVDKSLYSRVKSRANKKFSSKTGIYKSSWIVKEYKRLGGKYRGKKPSVKSPGLKRWYKEKWVDLNRPIKNSSGKVIGYKSCGRSSIKTKRYPLCRPSKRVTSGTPRTFKEISKSKIRRAKREKSRVRGSKNIKFGGGEKRKSPAESVNEFKKKRGDYKCEECDYTTDDNIDLYRHNLSEHGGIDMEKASELFAKTFSGKEYEWLFKDKGMSCNGKCGQTGGCGGLVCLAPLLLLGGGPQYYGKRSSVMIKVPENVKRTVLYSFKLKRLEFKGGVETGWKRAKQLATRDSISIQDLKYMRAWFARHIITSYPTYKKWRLAGRPKDSSWHNKRGIIAWLIWGGDAAFRWVNSSKNINLLNKHYNKSYKPMRLK